jgi:glycosyltransferase involved in cell wall biosynthesis
LIESEVLLANIDSDITGIPVRFMNSGGVVVESWISNTPVIQSDGVDPNLVEEGKNGYLFRRESIDECAEKMILAYNNRAQLPAFAEHGKILVKARYTYSFSDGLYNSV